MKKYNFASNFRIQFHNIMPWEPIASRPECLGLADSLSNMAGLPNQSDCFPQAGPLLEQAEELGSVHPKLVQTLPCYADYLHKSGKSDQSAQVEQRKDSIRMMMAKPQRR